MLDNGANGHGGHRSVGMVWMETGTEDDRPVTKDIDPRQWLAQGVGSTVVTIGGQAVMRAVRDTTVAKTVGRLSVSGKIAMESSPVSDHRVRVAAYQIHRESESVCRRRRAFIGLLLFFGMQIALGLWLGRRSSRREMGSHEGVAI